MSARLNIQDFVFRGVCVRTWQAGSLSSETSLGLCNSGRKRSVKLPVTVTSRGVRDTHNTVLIAS
jgi:hypothetical protein